MNATSKKSDPPRFISIAGGKPKQRNFAELEEELIRINHLLYDTQQQSKTAFLEYIPSTQKTTWSEFVYQIFDLEPFSVEPSDEVFDKLLHPDDLEPFIKMRSKIATEGMPEGGYEFRLVVNGKIKYCKMNGVCERDEEGNVTRLIATTQDITEQKESDNYRNIVNHFTRDLINLSSQKELIKYVAKEVVKKMGFEDCIIYLLDKKTNKLVQSAAYGPKVDQNQEIENPLTIPVGKGVTGQVAETKTPIIVDDVTIHEGYVHDIANMGSEICVPILHEGKLFGVIDCEHSAKKFFSLSHMGILSTIASILATKLRQWDSLEKRKKSENQLLDAQRLAHFGNWNMDIATNEIKWSDEVYRIFGYEPNSFVASYDAFVRSVHPDDAKFVSRSMQKAIDGEKDYDIDFRIIRPNNEIRYVHAIGEVIFSHGTEALKMIGTVHDITERKTAEAAAQASEAHLEEVFKLAPESIMTFDSNLNIILFNRSAEKTFGYKKEEVLGKHLNQLIPSDLRDRHDEHMDAFNKSGDTSIQMDDRQEISGTRKNGEKFPADVSVSKIEINGELVFIAMLRDITKRKQTETALNKALFEANRANKAKSSFLAVMSHELRTPLNAIMGFSEMMKSQIFGSLGSEKYVEYVQDIHTSSQHLLDLVNSILDLSAIDAKKHKLEREHLNLLEIITHCQSIVDGMYSEKNITNVFDIPKDIAKIYADPKGMKQILLNLLSNSIKFTPEGGQIKISAHTNKAGHVIKITDTGIGIPKEALENITNPFTKLENNPYKANEGTGLGLSIVKSLVELHGGALSIKSPQGKGTIVTITFPFNTDESSPSIG